MLIDRKFPGCMPRHPNPPSGDIHAKLCGTSCIRRDLCVRRHRPVAEQGVTSSEIRFAQVAAIEGPAAALGMGMQLGIQAAFAEANTAGGINGRTLTLETMDDGYEPSRSIDAVNAVIASNDYLALIWTCWHANHQSHTADRDRCRYADDWPLYTGRASCAIRR